MGGNPTGGYRRQLLLKTLVKLQGGRAANCSGNGDWPPEDTELRAYGNSPEDINCACNWWGESLVTRPHSRRQLYAVVG